LRRIPIVDDKVAIRLLLTKTFASAGYTVRTAMNALQAMALLAAESFDVLLFRRKYAIGSADGWTRPGPVGSQKPPGSRLRADERSRFLECQDCPFASGCNILAKPFKPQDAVAIIAQMLKEES
jgi:DNA-binding NtrC family response regulator